MLGTDILKEQDDEGDAILVFGKLLRVLVGIVRGALAL